MRKRTKIEDLLAVIKSRCEVTESGCWVWIGVIGKDGYGYFNWCAMKYRPESLPTYCTHRMTYILTNGPVAEGMQLDHLCRNRPCCNPAHLEPVTPSVNVRRSSKCQSPRTHCRRGHPYEGNSYIVRQGAVVPIRNCKTCQAMRTKKYVGANRESVAARNAAYEQSDRGKEKRRLAIQARKNSNPERFASLAKARKERHKARVLAGLVGH